ncbi:MAG: CoA transferase, partial [Dehalococcoidia bacterium]
MPALEEMRVLDMTQYEAGTSCTQILAWLGADVVKLERPGIGDPGRVFSNGPHGPAYFLNYNSNKRSLALDLSGERGRNLFLRLVPRYDVFVENFAPGVMEKLDIGYEVLKEINPRLIYGRMKGFGLSGPYANYKCYDMIAQAAGGAYSVTGEADGPPMRPGPTYGDTGSGLQMALAITAAYVQRQRTGRGQFIELSMQEAVTLFMRTSVASGSDWGQEAAPRTGNRAAAPTDLYPCAPGGPNDYVYIMVVTTRMWDTLCAAIGRPQLVTDARFETMEGRHENADALHAEISKWTRERKKQEVMQILGEAGVPCSYTFDTRDLWTDPHLRARDFIQTVQHPELESVELMRSPFRLSDSEVPLVAAPLLGEHSDEVLQQDIG